MAALFHEPGVRERAVMGLSRARARNLEGGCMDVLKSVRHSFSADYSEAREKFLTAAERAGAALVHYDNPNPGPRGEALATDVAWVGPEDARYVFLMLSATHGAEGFCGSACQLDWLYAGGAQRLPPDGAVALVHAINPHGFAWLRRVTEEGCDLNRNYVDFAAPLPENPGHDELVDCFVPESLDPQTLAKTEGRIQAWRMRHGEDAFQTARKAGQYKHPHSVFYGGAAPTWSRLTLERIAAEHRLAERMLTCVVDYHTGLGPFGYGEPICDHAMGSPGMERAMQMYGQSVGVPELGTSSSIPLHGTSREMWDRALGDRYTYIALEYGTYSPNDGLRALRADHWLHRQGGVDWDDEHTRRIKAGIRRQFYPDTDDWREMILWRSRQVQRQTLEGMARCS
jgi:hypothetical protein